MKRKDFRFVSPLILHVFTNDSPQRFADALKRACLKTPIGVRLDTPQILLRFLTDSPQHFHRFTNETRMNIKRRNEISYFFIKKD